MSLSNLAFTLLLVTTPLHAWQDKKQTKNLNLNPVSKPGTKANPKEVPQLHVDTRICEVGTDRFLVNDPVDEARCTEAGGSLKMSADGPKDLKEMKTVRRMELVHPPNAKRPAEPRSYDPSRPAEHNP